MQKMKRGLDSLLSGSDQGSKNNSKKKSTRALDQLNLTLGDVRDVFEPYLAIFLTADRQWNPAQVGIVLSATSIAGKRAQTPAGALIDSSRHKRWLVAIASLLVAISYFVIVNFSTFTAVISAQAVIGTSAVMIGPLISSISLGLVGKDRLDKRVGRNGVFNHAGNVIAAIIAGLLGQFVGRVWIFYLLILLCFISIASVFQIRKRDIDNTQARGGSQDNEQKATFKDLLRDRSLIIFGSCVVLFYLANAALLPLVSQQLTAGNKDSTSAYISLAIVVAQLTMIPVSAWAGKTANRWGRKPLMLIAFGALLTRAILYTFNHSPLYLVSLQVLDGISSGIFLILVVLIVADLTQGTGRFNLAQGLINTAVGIGASLSNIGSGFLVKAAGYNVGFMTLAGITAIGLGWTWLRMPETKKNP